jgi:hypothetical protein
MNASVEVIIVEIIAQNLPHHNGKYKADVSNGLKHVKVNLEVSSQFPGKP